MKDKPVILKLGGSVITIKDKISTPRVEAIKRLAREVARARLSSLIVVHGGGSYWHPLAKEYCITSGFTDPSQLIGFARTHEAMVSLNRLVVDALLECNVPALGMSPSSLALMDGGQVQVFETKPIEKAIEIGLTPVLYGDVVLDSKKGFGILSGDKIAASLAIKFGARRMVMAVDVDGLCANDPKTEPSAQLIRHLKLDDLRHLNIRIGRTDAPDVTGGMLGKVLELAEPIEHGVEALIVNGLKPNTVYKALRSEEFVGTRITKT